MARCRSIQTRSFSTSGALLLLSPNEPLLGCFASDCALALHQEEPGDLLESRQGDLVATSSRLDETPAAVAPAPGALAARSLEEGGDVCPVALDPPPVVIAKEAAHAVGVPLC